ncbi:MAG: TetR/AcrR family transcriptional regulator [Actinomycetes bacterium]|jgi:AcrR family transcriptional regulator
MVAARELSDKGAETRTLILDTAMELFATQGYLGTSVREVAARCGLTHPALIYHFPAKADLLMEVLRRRDDTEGREVHLDDLRGTEVLDHLVETARRNAGRRGIVELYATLSAEASTRAHPAHDYFVERYEGLRDRLTRAYAQAIEDGRMRAGIEPAVAATQVIALMDGLQVQWLLDPSVDMVGALAAHLSSQRV